MKVAQISLHVLGLYPRAKLAIRIMYSYLKIISGNTQYVRLDLAFEAYFKISKLFAIINCNRYSYFSLTCLARTSGEH